MRGNSVLLRINLQLQISDRDSTIRLPKEQLGLNHQTEHIYHHAYITITDSGLKSPQL
ncbi:MAG: hypothetical protein KME13_15920 [Myxacorys californica WJT36-NPBG1]|nr:hypothetical protein [Myxacorys californica WJT36-NPBG1]